MIGDGAHTVPLAGLSKSDLKAGQSFEVRVVGAPLSFKEARSVRVTQRKHSTSSANLCALRDSAANERSPVVPYRKTLRL